MNISTNNIAQIGNIPSQIQQSTVQEKMTAALKSTSISLHSTKPAVTQTHLNPDEKMKIDKFISELQQKDSDKEFFACVFKTMIHLGKAEKETFIAGVAQTLQSSPDEEMTSLSQRFNKSLQRYMAISLMSTPLQSQMNHNISQVNLDGEESDTDSEGIDII